MDRGATAWFALLRPATDPDAMGACGALAGGEPGDAQDPRWEAICTEFADVFAPPSTPHEREIKHRIELLPGSEPPSKR